MVENVFGILTLMFREFFQPLIVNHVDAISMHICALLEVKSGCYYYFSNHLDYKEIETGNIVQGRWRQMGKLVVLYRSSHYTYRNGKNIRGKFKNYFFKSNISKDND